MLRLPLSLFPPAEHQPWLAGAALSGGVPITGAPQTADASAGGWWIYEFTPALLRTNYQISQWRMMMGLLSSGVQLIEVPVLDAAQPWPADRIIQASTGQDIEAGPDVGDITADLIVAALTANAYMPAYPAPPSAPTVAELSITTGARLQGGEYFSVTGPSGTVRMHMITSITADDLHGNYTVTIVPPFREDTASGTALDFNNPRVVCKLDISSARDAWPSMKPPFLGTAKARFIESGFVVPAD